MAIKNKFKQGEFEQPAVPETLEDAFKTIDEITFPDERNVVMERDLESWNATTHHGLGTWIRNNWGFWAEEGPLYDYFVGLGLHHPDDMSGIVLESYWKRKHNVPLDIEGQVQYFLDYWAKQEAEST